MAGWILHPRVGSDDEVAGKPGAQPDEKRRPPVADASQSLFAKKKQSQKTGFEKKRKHAFHRQRLADDTTGGPGKRGPVGSELKFQGNAGDHADGEIDPEDSTPKS